MRGAEALRRGEQATRPDNPASSRIFQDFFVARKPIVDCEPPRSRSPSRVTPCFSCSSSSRRSSKAATRPASSSTMSCWPLHRPRLPRPLRRRRRLRSPTRPSGPASGRSGRCRRTSRGGWRCRSRFPTSSPRTACPSPSRAGHRGRSDRRRQGGILGGVVSAATPPRLIKKVEPVYPEDARLALVRGIVILQATTDVFGRVQSILVLRSIPLLDRAAIDAVKQWIYEPISSTAGRTA